MKEYVKKIPSTTTRNDMGILNNIGDDTPVADDDALTREHTSRCVSTDILKCKPTCAFSLRVTCFDTANNILRCAHTAAFYAMNRDTSMPRKKDNVLFCAVLYLLVFQGHTKFARATLGWGTGKRHSHALSLSQTHCV